MPPTRLGEGCSGDTAWRQGKVPAALDHGHETQVGRDLHPFSSHTTIPQRGQGPGAEQEEGSYWPEMSVSCLAGAQPQRVPITTLICKRGWENH